MASRCTRHLGLHTRLPMISQHLSALCPEVWQNITWQLAQHDVSCLYII